MPDSEKMAHLVLKNISYEKTLTNTVVQANKYLSAKK